MATSSPDHSTTMQLNVVDHPLAAQLLTVLRDETTDRAGFRRAMDDLSGILVYEAMRTAQAHPFEVRTPLGPPTGPRLSTPPLVVPVLRPRLGMPAGLLASPPQPPHR